jgi:hypothetical protein
MSGFLGFDPNDPLANKPNGAQGGLTWQALGGMPEQMWDGMNVWDKISLGTGLAAPLAAPIPPLAAGLAGVSAATGLLGAGQSVYEDPSLTNIGLNAIGVTPWGKLGKGLNDKLGIYVPPSDDLAQHVKDLEKAGASRDEIWQSSYDEFGTPAYRNVDGNIRAAIPDADAKLARPKFSMEDLEKDAEFSIFDLTEDGVIGFDADGNPFDAGKSYKVYAKHPDLPGRKGWGETEEAAKQAALRNIFSDQSMFIPDWNNPGRNVHREFTLKNVLHHPELYKHQPDLQNVQVRFDTTLGDNFHGMFEPDLNKISLNPNTLHGDESFLNTLVHEVQHGVQDHNNWAPGINPEAAKLSYDEAGALIRTGVNEGNQIMDTHQRLFAHLEPMSDETKQFVQNIKDEVASADEFYQRYQPPPRRPGGPPIRALRHEGGDTIGQRLYNDASGEVEARLTESQRKIANLRDQQPWNSETWQKVPEEYQVVFGGTDGTTIQNVPGLQEGSLLRQIEASQGYPSSGGGDPWAHSGSLLDTGYRGVHTAPVREGANSLDDLSDIYPDDVYDPRVSAQYYGHSGAGNPNDVRTAEIVAAFQGRPDADVTVYRAVPKGVKGINAGDWVTINKNYAQDHGSRYVGDDFEIIEMKVKAKDLVTDGNSIHEWGYDPAD